MVFYLGTDLRGRLSCWLENKYEQWTHHVWLSKPHHVNCKICGGTMRSDREKFSPEEAGWKHVDYFWICHRCLEHRDFKPYIKQIDEDERKLWEK